MVSGTTARTATLIGGLFAASAFLSAQTPPATVSSGFRPSTSFSPPPSNAPGNVISPELRGDIFMARKMYREAVEAYQEGPETAVLLNKTGIAYHQLLDLNSARRYYQRALKVNPSYPEAINNLGTIEYSRKNYRRSIVLYKRALRYSPNSGSIYSNLGTAQFARRSYKEATESFQKALELDPEVFEHHNTQGVLLQERAIEERAKFHYYLSKMYAKSGSAERALLYMRKAIEEGFKDRKKFEEDPEFIPLRELPEFKQLLAMETRAL